MRCASCHVRAGTGEYDKERLTSTRAVHCRQRWIKATSSRLPVNKMRLPASCARRCLYDVDNSAASVKDAFAASSDLPESGCGARENWRSRLGHSACAVV